MTDPALVSDVIAGLLIEVVASAGRRVMTALRRSRRNRDGRAVEDQLFDFSGPIPRLVAEVDQAALVQVLRRPALQALAHELFAIRLSAAPETEVIRLRTAMVDLVVAVVPQEGERLGLEVFDYLDRAFGELTARLGANDRDLLLRIRQDAYLSRINSTLSAIERHTAVLGSAGDDVVAGERFLARYRAHVSEHHGKLEPPDFERRRRIRIEDLYVTPTLTTEDDTDPSIVIETDIWELADNLDRAVVLGDPGCGKTTASHVVMHRYATETRNRVPFLVTLREFAAEDPPTRSVVGFIDHQLEVFYQCPAPHGWVERLLLDGSAVVIFDGLDELIDTSRRAEVAAAVERFAAEYPHSAVMVTSRTIGYAQAALDESQFVRYQITGFDGDRVSEYVHKWFAQDDTLTAAEAERQVKDFVQDSETVADIRSNPLMLALMCILYRGEGSIPRNRPELYEQCATLLFRRWDARRRIHVDLRARNLIEPAIRHLAYWLFTRDSAEPAVTERLLVAESTQYFHLRGFEQLHDATAVAREFVDFCRGRMWVFSDAGTTAHGEELFTFTHRTFMEYFAAVELASLYDTPAKLARRLAPYIARQEWEVVAQIAIQVKDRTAKRGAERGYDTLLTRRGRSRLAQENTIAFLCRGVAFLSLPPRQLRRLVREAVELAFLPSPGAPKLAALAYLVAGCTEQFETAADELSSALSERLEHPDRDVRTLALRLAIYADHVPFLVVDGHPTNTPWHEFAGSNRNRYQEMIKEFAVDVDAFALTLYDEQVLTIGDLLDRFGPGIEVLFRYVTMVATSSGRKGNHSFVHNSKAVGLLVQPTRDHTDLSWYRRQLGELQRRFAELGEPPWLDRNKAGRSTQFDRDLLHASACDERPFDPTETAALGVLLCMCAELAPSEDLAEPAERVAYLADFAPYLRSRNHKNIELPVLAVPERYQRLFTRWANRKTDFVESPTA